MDSLIYFGQLEPYTVKPVYSDHPMGHLDELQKAEIISKSKFVPSVFIKTRYWINHRQQILL